MRYGYISCVTRCTRDMLLQIQVSHGQACLGRLNDCLRMCQALLNRPHLYRRLELLMSILDPVRYENLFYKFFQYLTGMRMFPIYEDCWYHQTDDTPDRVNRLWHEPRWDSDSECKTNRREISRGIGKARLHLCTPPGATARYKSLELSLVRGTW
jgi:hypothetical protein